MWLFPLLVVSVFVGAGISAIIEHNWNNALYSFAAAVLNYAIYFKPFH
jgi:hypothetical protein